MCVRRAACCQGCSCGRDRFLTFYTTLQEMSEFCRCPPLARCRRRSRIKTGKQRSWQQPRRPSSLWFFVLPVSRAGHRSFSARERPHYVSPSYRPYCVVQCVVGTNPPLGPKLLLPDQMQMQRQRPRRTALASPFSHPNHHYSPNAELPRRNQEFNEQELMNLIQSGQGGERGVWIGAGATTCA